LRRCKKGWPQGFGIRKKITQREVAPVKKRIILVSVFILWTAALVVAGHYRIRHAVESARQNERRSCDIFLRQEEQETELHKRSEEKCQKWAAHVVVTGRWLEGPEGSK